MAEIAVGYTCGCHLCALKFDVRRVERLILIEQHHIAKANGPALTKTLSKSPFLRSAAESADLNSVDQSKGRKILCRQKAIIAFNGQCPYAISAGNYFHLFLM